MPRRPPPLAAAAGARGAAQGTLLAQAADERIPVSCRTALRNCSAPRSNAKEALRLTFGQRGQYLGAGLFARCPEAGTAPQANPHPTHPDHRREHGDAVGLHCPLSPRAVAFAQQGAPATGAQSRKGRRVAGMNSALLAPQAHRFDGQALAAPGVSVSKVGGKCARRAAEKESLRKPFLSGGPVMAELPLTPAQEAEAQALFQRLQSAVEREAVQLARLMVRKEDRPLRGGTEGEGREQGQRLGAQVLETARQARKTGGTLGRVPPCPCCPDTAGCVASRGKTLVSLLGPLRVERHSDPCTACGQGCCPWEGVLGVTGAAVSPAAAEEACRAGVHASLAAAREQVVPKRAGRRVAEARVERTREAAGVRRAAAQTAGQSGGRRQEGAWPKDTEGKRVAYGAVEATGVAQQGRAGATADSRRATGAVLSTPVRDDPAYWAHPAAGWQPPWPARSVASRERVAALGATVRQQGGRWGWSGLRAGLRWPMGAAGGKRSCARTGRGWQRSCSIAPPRRHP